MIGKYPHIQFRTHWELSRGVLYRLGQCDAIVQAICDMPLGPEYHKELLRVSLVKGARATTAIEGNTLSDEEVERVAAGESLPPSKEYQEIEVRNILDAMNALLKEITVGGRAEIISADLIRRFHSLVGKDLGVHFDAVPGHFRSDPRIVGTYRCPDYEDVPELVGRLCDWLHEEFGYATGRQSFADAVAQAIVTHVYLEWIHPFGDGNGRTGRLLEFYVLLRAGNPDIASHILSNFYNETRAEYYRQLDRAMAARDLSAFIAYAVEGFRDGLVGTLKTIQQRQFQTAWRSFIYEQFAGRRYRKKKVFKRRRELILNMPTDQEFTLEELSILSPTLAREYATLSPRTLLRDLAVLQEMTLVRRIDSRYTANSILLRSQMARRIHS